MKKVVRTKEVQRLIRGKLKTIRVIIYEIEANNKTWYTVEVKRGFTRVSRKAELPLSTARDIFNQKFKEVKNGKYDKGKDDKI